MTLIAYHGFDRDIPADNRKMPRYFGDRDLAQAYAEDGGEVRAYAITLDNPLVIDTPEKVEALWRESGALIPDRPFFPDCCEALNRWVKARGHDGLIIAAAAFGGELGFEWAAGTFGEPQIVAFHPELQVRETEG